jgi:hypothetical protein
LLAGYPWRYMSEHRGTRMDPTFEKILLVFAGWILGLLSPIIVDLIKRQQERQEIQTALTTELQELQFRLLAMVYLIAHEKGVYDRKLLKWIQSTMVNYTGIHRDTTLLNEVESLLKLTHQELSTVAALARKKDDGGLSLKKILNTPSRCQDFKTQCSR